MPIGVEGLGLLWPRLLGPAPFPDGCVDVIATDFGGNTDFCTGPLAHPVRWRPAPIPRGAYPFGDGHSWAEPDLEHAAELCRQVAARR